MEINRLDTRSQIIASPGLAQHLLRCCRCERQRKVNISNINHIKPTQIYFRLMPDGSMAILNGQQVIDTLAAE